MSDHLGPQFDEYTRMAPIHMVLNAPSGDSPSGRGKVRHQLRTVRKDPEYPALLDSVRQHGIQRPIFGSAFARPTDVIDDGHHRMAAAVDAGLTHVPVNTGWMSEQWENLPKPGASK
jgi:hypothetical protein